MVRLVAKTAFGLYMDRGPSCLDNNIVTCNTLIFYLLLLHPLFALLPTATAEPNEHGDANHPPVPAAKLLVKLSSFISTPHRHVAKSIESEDEKRKETYFCKNDFSSSSTFFPSVRTTGLFSAG